MDDERVSAVLDVAPVTIGAPWATSAATDEVVLRTFLATLCEPATARRIAGQLIANFGEIARALQQSDRALRAAAPGLTPQLVAALRAIGKVRERLSSGGSLAA